MINYQCDLIIDLLAKILWLIKDHKLFINISLTNVVYVNLVTLAKCAKKV